MLVKSHFALPPSEIVQRFNFHTISQQQGESVAEFVPELKHLSSGLWDQQPKSPVTVAGRTQGFQVRPDSRVG